MKVVINNCFGGFSISQEATEWIKNNRNPDFEWDGYGYQFRGDESRADPDLVACVEALGGKKASGDCASLKIVEIPDGIEWGIHEYDGIEHVEEKHMTWG